MRQEQHEGVGGKWQAIVLSPLSALFFGLVGLVGCGSHPPTPVIDRATAPVALPVTKPVTATATVEPTPGYYIVKKGDTLYSIALDHGLSHRDLAGWNNLEDPNKIQAGQQLRVSATAPPPENAAPVAVTKPVSGTAPVEARPLDTASGTPVASSNTETLKREPKGGRLPYSEQALAQLQQPENASPPPAARTQEQKTESVVKQPQAAAAAVGEDVVWAWPTTGKVTGNYVEGSNKGVDIAGKLNDPVFAAAPGTVSYVGSALRGYGNLVVIKHNATFLSVYAHNSKILVKEGQKIIAGQKIAEIGSTESDQPKLHFEIRRQGKPVDPLKYLPNR